MFGIEKEPVLKIGVVGLGLIGGSMAKAFKRCTPHIVYGCDKDAAVLNDAAGCNAIDHMVKDFDFSMCDLVFIALYPQQTVDFVKKHIGTFRPGSILMDLCGIKGYVVKSLASLCAEHQITYIGGHPMAGKECWGFCGADAQLFRGASMIVTPDGDTPEEALDLLTGLFADIGFGTINRITPEAHDAMIAFTSQLAHVVSSAYIKSPRAQRHDGFSAGSYKDLTRVAKLNPQMWTELFLENSGALLEEIDTLITHIHEYRDAIAEGDSERLYKLLDHGRRIKEALDHEND